MCALWLCLASGRRGAAGYVVEGGHAELGGRAAVDLGELVLGAGEADLESFDLAEPALALGFSYAGCQVVADLNEPTALGGVGPERRGGLPR
jgi:hypothetical protein